MAEPPFSPATYTASVDALFGYIEAQHGSRPWGAVLDAGTGSHSLRWISKLKTTRWAAVTGDPQMASTVKLAVGSVMRPTDRILTGNWTDNALLAGERFDVVIADYLLGAVEGFAPYFQSSLFARLKPLVGDRLYIVGLEPYPEKTDSPWGQIVLEVARLRNACISLSGHRSYREYPLSWTLRQLKLDGFTVTASKTFGIRYGHEIVARQLAVGEQYLPSVTDRALATALRAACDHLKDRSRQLVAAQGTTTFGENYVVCAQRSAD